MWANKLQDFNILVKFITSPYIISLVTVLTGLL